MPLVPDHDVLIIGAGLSGCYACHRMHQLNLNVKVLEAATSVGGTWYWNRYPGARFDSESYTYGFFFSQEVLDEWKWKEHFAGQEETEQYVHFICDKFNLWKDMQFNTRVKKAYWMSEHSLWKLTDQDGKTYTARFLITGLGVLTDPTLPNIPGVHDFKGGAYHTARWPKKPVDFRGKKVGVIGVGATAIQLIPEVAKTAKTLTVFQRTPNWAIPLHNSKIDPEEMEKIRVSYPEIYKLVDASRASFIHDLSEKSIWDATPEEREAFWEHLYAQPGFGFWLSNYRETQMDRKANALLSDFVAKKIRERVKDPWTADKLIPKTYGFGMRRVPMETFFYEAFNEPHVRLVDLLETPIEKITANGLKTTSEEFDFDILIYATGFSAITGGFDAIDFRGVNDVRLVDKWRKELRTYLGLTVKDFPNMFMSLGPHQGYGNISRGIEYAVGWIADCIEYLITNDISYIEPTEEKVQEWTDHVIRISKGLLSNEVDSWMTGVNKNLPGKQKRIVARWSGSAPSYRKRCDAVAKAQYNTFLLRRADGQALESDSGKKSGALARL